MNDTELRARLREAAEDGDPWADPMPEILRRARQERAAVTRLPLHRRIPGAIVGIAAVLVVLVGVGFLIKAAGTQDVKSSSGTSAQGAADSAGGAASSLTPRGECAVIPSASKVPPATVTLTAPARFTPDGTVSLHLVIATPRIQSEIAGVQKIRVFALSGGRVVGELAEVTFSTTPTTSTTPFGIGLEVTGSFRAGAASASCGAPVGTSALPAGTYQLQALVTYGTDVTPARTGTLLSSPVTVTVG